MSSVLPFSEPSSTIALWAKAGAAERSSSSVARRACIRSGSGCRRRERRVAARLDGGGAGVHGQLQYHEIADVAVGGSRDRAALLDLRGQHGVGDQAREVLAHHV